MEVKRIALESLNKGSLYWQMLSRIEQFYLVNTCSYKRSLLPTYCSLDLLQVFFTQGGEGGVSKTRSTRVRSLLISRCVFGSLISDYSRLQKDIRRVPLIEQELLTLSEHLNSSPLGLVGFVLLNLQFSVYFVHRSLEFCLVRLLYCLCFFDLQLLIILSF